MPLIVLLGCSSPYYSFSNVLEVKYEHTFSFPLGVPAEPRSVHFIASPGGIIASPGGGLCSPLPSIYARVILGLVLHVNRPCINEHI